jgi:hypothetical protein
MAIADKGPERLGFTPEDCGTHSVRSAAAMAMHMASVPAYTILTIGHSINPFNQSIQSIPIKRKTELRNESVRYVVKILAISTSLLVFHPIHSINPFK